MLTEEATNAYRKVTSRPAPVLPSGPQVPSQSDLPVQPAPPVPPSGEIPLSLFEKHLGRETPFRLRSELLKVPRALGTAGQVASLISRHDSLMKAVDTDEGAVKGSIGRSTIA